jgi:hypothetical protein
MNYILDFGKWKRLYEAEESPEYTTAPLGETGIYVAYAETPSAQFNPVKDMSYIVVGDGMTDIKFVGNRNGFIREIILRSDNHDYPGVRRSDYKTDMTSADQDVVEKVVYPSSKTMTFFQAMDLLPLIVRALYGEDATGTSVPRLTSAIKAIKMINTDYSTYITGNTLFSNLRTYTWKASTQRDINALATAARVAPGDIAGGQRIIDAAKAAYQS